MDNGTLIQYHYSCILILGSWFLKIISKMNEYIIILIFIAWYALSLMISETIGKKKKIGVQWSFFLSMILSPVIGYLITKFGSKALQTVK